MDPRSLYPDAGSHRIDSFIAATNRDLGPFARFAGHAVNLDDALGYLRHFRGKELLEEFGPRTGEQYLRPPTRLEHFVYIAPHGIALAVALAADLLLVWHRRLGPAEVEHDVAVTDLLYGAGFDEANPADKLVVYSLALSFAHPLDENLLCRLDGVAAKVGKIEWLDQYGA